MIENDSFGVDFLHSSLGISSEKIHIFESVVSTNTLMKEYAEKGCGEWEIIISRTQSGGRGRIGRSFFSSRDSGLYLSILLRPSFSPQNANLITTCAAVCACEAIFRVCKVKADIKWVNDIYIDGKKVAGILTEGDVDLENGLFKYAVIGIGINVYTPKEGFPDDIKSIAGAVFNNSDTREDVRLALASEFIKAFMKRYRNLMNDDSLYSEYSQRMFLTGKDVDVILHCGNTVKKAVVLGVEPDFSLKVRYDDMTEEKLYGGEVSLRVKKGI